MNHNISYQTDQLVRYFSRYRVAWSHFYESERVIISELELTPRHGVLDIGCGCGGLGLALRERYGVESYTGVEINPSSAAAGRRMNPRARILCGDILELSGDELRERRFDVVFSLSCVDWNVQFAEMLTAAWDRVVPGGHLVATFRVTDARGCDDMSRSYQYINYDGMRKGERAAYVVLNAKDLAWHFGRFDPCAINAYGYWGVPSSTAITPYVRLCFAAFSLQKRSGGDGPCRRNLNLPLEIREAMESVCR